MSSAAGTFFRVRKHENGEPQRRAEPAITLNQYSVTSGGRLTRTDLMETAPQLVDKRAPICGGMAIAAPFVGVAVALLADRGYDAPSRPEDEAWRVAVWLVLLVYGSIMSGLILTCVAVARDEKYWVLRWVGFLVNAGPFLYAVIAS
jgi:UDP-N-acetylmuramyl pentapeptide phosphotransferase/UDP-N-acetylglucosamine-1-phosphate transferase